MVQKRGKPWLPEHIAPAKFIAEHDYNIQYFFAKVNSFMRILFEMRKNKKKENSVLHTRITLGR